MNCQQCERPATFHITELTEGKPQELHLCEEHARQYLSDTEEESPPVVGSLAGLLAQKLAVGETAEELARLEHKACPDCGITFLEFRKQGRLGCSHDYEFFAEELEPLLLNIHGELQHIGKVPRSRGDDSERRTRLIRMRREMKEAVAAENYERASELRDEIHQMEQRGGDDAVPDDAVPEDVVEDIAEQGDVERPEGAGDEGSRPDPEA